MTKAKTLLKENKKALQFLHAAHGFDFEKDFFFKREKGRFTYNTVKKAIEEKINDNYVAAVLIKESRNGWHNQKLHYAKLNGVKFEPLRANNLNYWKYDIDYFFSIGDFEETRKNGTDTVYIIAQKKEYILPTEKKTVDFSQRFILLEYDWAWTAYPNGHKYINRIELKATDGKPDVIKIEPYNRFYGNEKKSGNVNDFIDKSGFLLRDKRFNLLQRANALRAERAKIAVDNKDYSEEENKLNAAIKEAREKLAAELLTIETEEAAQKLEKKLSSLRWALWCLERYNNKNANGDYSSIKAKNDALLTIWGHIGKTEENNQ